MPDLRSGVDFSCSELCRLEFSECRGAATLWSEGAATATAVNNVRIDDNAASPVADLPLGTEINAIDIHDA
ncbi:hypothetical protein FRX31_021258 [Thalictrum thalictroides]|uniref:Uncharacterized protein n=1 Tax=Thalictrum thalictroides TaxID=46969 RepID=A0A7J6VYI0_THATH|nr:hypothetical protein FRX31_021258 [Thalictrum thalictroides]